MLEPSFSPFRFSGELERDFENLLNDGRRSDYFETDGHFFTSMDMPGVNGKDINIEIEDNKVVVTAERKKYFENRGEQNYKYQQSFCSSEEYGC
jgi:HSP20 family molecular chaperone IbpA